jgi:hypothetical protein
MSTNGSITTASILKNPLSFFEDRIPNRDEVVTNFLNKATMDITLGRVYLQFGKNPTAGAVFRDTLRISVSYELIGTEIGSTGIYHDEGGMYAAMSKTICKSAILFTYSLIPVVQNLEFETVARSGNYICEAPARFLNVVSRERQLAIKSLPADAYKKTYSEFLMQDAKISWAGEALVSGVFKTSASDQMGEVVKKIGYTTLIKETAALTENAIVGAFGGNMRAIFLPGDDIYTKCYKASMKFDFNMWESRPYVACISIIVLDWMANVANDALNSVILITATKVVQDFVGAVIRDIMDDVKKMGYTDFIKETAALTENFLVSILGGRTNDILLPQDGISTKCFKSAMNFNFNIFESGPYVACVSITAIDLIASSLIFITSTEDAIGFVGQNTTNDILLSDEL